MSGEARRSTAEDEVDVELVDTVEALLFAASAGLRAREIAGLLDLEDGAPVRLALDVLQRRRAGRGVELVRVAGRYQLRTAPRFGPLVQRLRRTRPVKLSRAALETAAIVAYQQPVTKHEIEQLRGVASGGVLRTLQERELLRVVGRAETPGRPLQYGTTASFLELFGLRSLGQLPELSERDDGE